MSDDSTLQPFHDSIVGAIQRTLSGYELGMMGKLIKETKIPKNHDAIVEAWNEKAIYFRFNDPEVAESVLAQKPAEPAES